MYRTGNQLALDPRTPPLVHPIRESTFFVAQLSQQPHSHHQTLITWYSKVQVLIISLNTSRSKPDHEIAATEAFEAPQLTSRRRSFQPRDNQQAATHCQWPITPRIEAGWSEKDYHLETPDLKEVDLRNLPPAHGKLVSPAVPGGGQKNWYEKKRIRTLVYYVYYAGIIVLLALVVGLSAGLVCRNAYRSEKAASVRAVQADQLGNGKEEGLSSQNPTRSIRIGGTAAEGGAKPTAVAKTAASKDVRATPASTPPDSSAALTKAVLSVPQNSTRPSIAFSPASLSPSPPTSTSTGPNPTGTNTPESLARTFGMSPAFVPNFTLPTTNMTLHSAQSFIEDNWNYSSGVSKFVGFVPDPFGDPASYQALENGTVVARDNQTMVLSLEYPKGSMGGADAIPGGAASMMFNVFGEGVGVERSIMSYKVAFSKDFDFVNGGKLPGMYGGSGFCSGGQRTDGCFSARLMWRSNGTGEVYTYIPVYDGMTTGGLGASNITLGNTTLGKRESDLERRAFGLSLGHSTFNFSTTGWNEVTQVIALNTDPGAVGPANGYLAMYHNGNLAFERADIVYRLNSSVLINQFFFSSFFGGSGSSFWASKGGFSYFKDFKFYSGNKLSTVKGNFVTATLPANQ
ncbi:hypothetical protein T439DRAFT_352708 [Meredithblackwellia eburnea MCA 4105]